MPPTEKKKNGALYAVLCFAILLFVVLPIIKFLRTTVGDFVAVIMQFIFIFLCFYLAWFFWRKDNPDIVKEPTKISLMNQVYAILYFGVWVGVLVLLNYLSGMHPELRALVLPANGLFALFGVSFGIWYTQQRKKK